MADIDGMAIARKRVAKERAERTGTLDLGNLGLTDFPEEIAELTHLRSLNVGRHGIDAEGKIKWRERENSNRLYAADWSFLKCLQNLETLAVFDCSIANLQPLMAAQNLTHLLI